MSFSRASFSKASVQTDRHSIYHAAQPAAATKPMGMKRAVGSALSIIIGLILCYASLHYVPTFLKPSSNLDALISPSKLSERQIEQDRLKRLGVYAQNFLIRRTYLRSGQKLRATYRIPNGASLDLHIKQCRRMFIVEVFHCDVISQSTVTISDKSFGSRSLTFPDAGFYHFDETLRLVEPNGDYRLIWSRN